MHSSSSVVPRPRIISLTAGAVIAALAVFGLGAPQSQSFASSCPTATDPAVANPTIVASGLERVKVEWDLPTGVLESHIERFEFAQQAPGGGTILPLSNSSDATSFAAQSDRAFAPFVTAFFPGIWVEWNVLIRGVYGCSGSNVDGPWQEVSGSPFVSGQVPEPAIVTSVTTPRPETLRVTWNVHPFNQGGRLFDSSRNLDFEVAALLDDGNIDPEALAQLPEVLLQDNSGLMDSAGIAAQAAVWSNSVSFGGTCSSSLTQGADITDSVTCDIEGLIAGESYFVAVRAENSAGLGVWGTFPPPDNDGPVPAQAVIPTVLPPSTPRITNVSAGVESAEVTVDRGSSGGPPASFVVTASPGGATCTVTGTSGSCTVSGLAGGVAHTFTAVATNATGSSSPTSASTAVTPTVAPSNQGGTNQGGQSGQGTPSKPTGNASGATTVLPLTQTQTPGSAVSAIPSRPSTPTPTPSPQTSGQTPSASGLSAAQSGPLATVGGQVVAVQSSVTSPTQLELQVGKVSLGVGVAQGAGSVGSGVGGSNSDAVGIELTNGAATVFEGGGLTPGSAVQVVLPLAGDNSAVLAVLEVAEDGTFSGEAAFGTTPDGDPLPIGVRVVQLFTVDEDGNDVVIEVAVTIGQPDPTPAINRADGSVPALPVGEALGTSAGLPQVIEVRAIEEQKRAVVDGGDWSMAVDVASSTGGVQSVDSGAQLTLVRDESAMVSGTGFMAGTRADVWLFSEPTLLGTVTVDENGEFVGEVTIDGIVIPAGEHTLQLQGVGQDGYVKATSLGVAVDDVTAPMPSDTASSSIWVLLLAIGGLAILLIAVFIVAVRRQMQKQ